MQVLTLGTGSKGNSYILSDDDGNSLILDAGVKIETIKRALNFNFQSVSGVLITHEHKDHDLCGDELESYGLEVWRPYIADNGIDRKTFGAYAVSCFDVPHDGCTNYGFFIRHTSGFKMIYLTDCEYCAYRFAQQKPDFILCECNWSKEYVNLDVPYARHKLLGHFSLDACIDFLKVNKTDALQTIAICHTSPFSLDIPEAVERIKEETGIENVYVAKKNKTIQL